MAKLCLTLHNVTCYESASSTTTTTKTINVATETDASTAFLKGAKGIESFNLSLIDLSFMKKMYQPTEVIAELQISPSDGQGGEIISRNELENAFKHIRVDLSCEQLNNLGSNAIFNVGYGFYVHEVQTYYKKKYTYVTLKIYSLDKLLTLKKVSRTFLTMTLNDILTAELKKYMKPYDTNSAVTHKDYMKVLYYKRGKGTFEHIFPYLVQYNESFYDMLARTCNRWGEFLYFEDGYLNVGYPNNTCEIPEYRTLNYLDLGSKTPTVSNDGKFDYEGADEKSIIDNTLKKSPNSISGIMYSPGDKFDKVVMKKLANFFKNDKTLPAFIVNEIVDDTIEIGSKAVQRDYANDEFNKTYFDDKPGADEQYGTHNFGSIGKPEKEKGYNQFSEIDSEYDNGKYKTILKKEQEAAKNAVCIDFDTTYPNVGLGDFIEVGNDKLIVVEVSTKKETTTNYEIKTDGDGKQTIEVTPQTKIVFQIIATPKNSLKDDVVQRDSDGEILYEKVNAKDRDDNDIKDDEGNVKKVYKAKTENKYVDENYYPAVLPSGHVRYSNPQIATITDNNDPSGKNRVRVMFPWEDIYTDYDDKVTDDTKKISSPWLTFSTNASGAPTVGKHYIGNKVLVGFINGNVERPYVLGGLEAKGDKADISQTSPGGHYLKINDDPSGVSKFLTGMFLPGWKSLSAFVPQMGELPETEGDTGIKLGGGFELSDYYGIYKISGSTDTRSVTVASPWGNVAINAFTGITISAPNGDVKITGKNVMIEAGNNLTLTSGTNVKKRLWNGSGSGFANNLGADIASAVAKKLADTLLNLVTIDLTIVRNVFDIVFRPLEGKLLVKSNRYLMLESGKGECVYPEAAFKDGKKREQAIKERTENDIRPGLYLASYVVDIAKRINSISNLIANNWLESYNWCVAKKAEFELAVDDAATFAKDYTGANIPVICKSYNDLIDDLWDHSETPLDVTKLGFKKDNFDTDDLNNVDVNSKAYNDYFTIFPDREKTNGNDVNLAKKYVLATRERKQKEVVNAANDLRKAIITFKKCCEGISEDEIKKQLATIKSANVPESFKKAVFTAFKKEKLGDIVFYDELDDFIKSLRNKFKEDDIKPDRKCLKRKASVVWLETMGFKDEWRKAVPRRDENNAPVDTEDAQGKPIPGSTVVPDRVFDCVDIIDDIKWDDYVNSLTAVPKLSPVQWKIANETMKSLKGWGDKAAFWKNMKENLSWGEAKNGGILFSFDQNTYDLNKETTKPIPTIAKEKLTELDDHEGGVSTFLNCIRILLKDFK